MNIKCKIENSQTAKVGGYSSVRVIYVAILHLY